MPFWRRYLSLTRRAGRSGHTVHSYFFGEKVNKVFATDGVGDDRAGQLVAGGTATASLGAEGE
jgi:hypothetical protein